MTASTPLIPVSKTRSGATVCARAVAFLIAATTLVLFSAGSGATQRKTATPAGEEEASPFKDYRGVQLGMTADEVRKKLGTPKDKGDEQDFFVFGDNESARALLRFRPEWRQCGRCLHQTGVDEECSSMHKYPS